LIEKTIVEQLIDQLWFLPTKWKVPLIYHHPYDPELDHDWYEFESVEYIEETATEENDIIEFLSNISSLET
jgi:hypothetical protein